MRLNGGKSFDAESEIGSEKKERTDFFVCDVVGKDRKKGIGNERSAGVRVISVRSGIALCVEGPRACATCSHYHRGVVRIACGREVARAIGAPGLLSDRVDFVYVVYVVVPQRQASIIL